MSDEAFDPKLGVELYGDVAYLVFTCPSCGKNRHGLADLHPGTKVICSCGKTELNLGRSRA